MSTRLSLKEKVTKLKIINNEKILEKQRKEKRINSLYQELDRLNYNYESTEFTARTLAEYYKLARESNLNELGIIIGETMEEILGKSYDVGITIKKIGQYDYLDINVNGVSPQDLSGGEKQVLSLLLVAECVTNEVLILDETINSLDPFTQVTVLRYLEDLSKNYQIVIIELDDNLDMDYNFIVDKGGVEDVSKGFI